jgi:hypothetical protein
VIDRRKLKAVVEDAEPAANDRCFERSPSHAESGAEI